MSTSSYPEKLDDAYKVQESLASNLSSEHTPSLDSLDPCMRSSTCSSMRHTPTVRFAPLPSPDPSRKRSVLPLGVAARSRRRHRLVRETAERGPSLWANDPAADPLLEDPLFTLGKYVKSASKSLWRRIRERSGLAGQVHSMHYLPDAILETGSVEDQIEVILEDGQTGVNPEMQMGASVEHASNNVKWQWRRSTGTMPSVPGLH